MLNNIKIVDIQKTKKGFYSLFCEDGFLFSVEDIQIISEKIKIGSCFTQQELTLIYEKSQSAKAVARGYNFLSFRPHAKAEIYRKLLKYYDSECCDKAVLKLEELGLLDDVKFCESRLNYLLHTKNLSLSHAKLKLLTLGIDKDIIDSCMEIYEMQETQKDSLERLLATKYKSKLFDHEKLTQSLLRRGFSYYEIKKALENINNESCPPPL